MSIPKTFLWCLVAFMPTVVGLVLIGPMGAFLNKPDSGGVVGVWICFDVVCSVVACLWLMAPIFRTRSMGVCVGLVTGIAVALLNGLITFFAGCVLGS